MKDDLDWSGLAELFPVNKTCKECGKEYVVYRSKNCIVPLDRYTCVECRFKGSTGKIITLETRLENNPPNGFYLYVLDLKVESENDEAWYGIPVLTCCSRHVSNPVGVLRYPKHSWRIE